MTNIYDVEKQAFIKETYEHIPGNSTSWWTVFWPTQTTESFRKQSQPLTQKSKADKSTNSTSWWRNWWSNQTTESCRDQRQSLNKQSDVKATINRSWFWNWWNGQTPKRCLDQEKLSNQQNNAEITANSELKDAADYTDTQELKQDVNEAEKKRAKERTKISNQKDTIARLNFQISALKQDFEALQKEKQLLLTRLSQISSVQLTEGNPNIADLSDPNRQDKLAEQMSELYDNQWTDSFQVLCETQRLQEEMAINVLLKIIMTTYEECRSHADKQYRQLIESICSFTGVKVRDGTNETIIRESIHTLSNYRAKHFAASMAHIKNKVDETLQRFISSDVCSVCEVYIAECTKICWLMCIKSPPMYISARTTDKFDHSLYTSYTKCGKHVSYVVWPTLFQHENGPVMKKGVAQGIN